MKQRSPTTWDVFHLTVPRGPVSEVAAQVKTWEQEFLPKRRRDRHKMEKEGTGRSGELVLRRVTLEKATSTELTYKLCWEPRVDILARSPRL